MTELDVETILKRLFLPNITVVVKNTEILCLFILHCNFIKIHNVQNFIAKCTVQTYVFLIYVVTYRFKCIPGRKYICLLDRRKELLRASLNALKMRK